MFLRKLFTAAVAAASITGSASLFAADAEYTFKLHHFLPPMSMQHSKVFVPWAEKIAEESNGRINIEIYPTMQLGGKPPHLYDQVRKGVVDMSWTVGGYTPGRFPKATVFELPFMVTDARSVSMALQEYMETEIADEFEDVHVLALHAHARGVLHSRETQIKTMEDLKGLKVRAPNKMMAGAFEILNRNNAISRSGSTLQLEYLQTHPLSSNRVAEARNRAANLNAGGDRDSREYKLFRARMQVLSATNRTALADRYRRNDPKLGQATTRYALALIALLRGDAESGLSTMTQSKPGNTLSEQILHAQLLYGSGQNQAGHALLNELIELYPARYSPVDALAELLRKDAELDKAYQMLSDYSQRNSDPAIQVWRDLAAVESARGHRGRSHEFLATWFEQQAMSSEAARQLELALRQSDLTPMETLRIEARLKQLRSSRTAQRG